MLDAVFVLICILLLYLSFLLGFLIRSIVDRMRRAETAIAELVKTSIKKKTVEPEKKSLFIDPDDPVQLARYEHEQLLHQLNPMDEDET